MQYGSGKKTMNFGAYLDQGAKPDPQISFFNIVRCVFLNTFFNFSENVWFDLVASLRGCNSLVKLKKIAIMAFTQ